MSDKNGSAKPDVAALRAEIARTRADLGETVQALAAKADVKARAREQIEQTKQRVKAEVATVGHRALEVAQQGRARAASAVGEISEPEVRRSPVPLALVVAGIAAAVGIILIVRGSRR